MIQPAQFWKYQQIAILFWLLTRVVLLLAAAARKRVNSIVKSMYFLRVSRVIATSTRLEPRIYSLFTTSSWSGCLSVSSSRFRNETSVNHPIVPDNRPSVRKAQEYWSNVLSQRNVPEAESSVRHILCHILHLTNVCQIWSFPTQTLCISTYFLFLMLQLDMLSWIQDEKLNPAECKLLEKYAELRLKRMPVQYIIGEWDFLDLTLEMSPSVFIPRPETEDLVSISSSLITDGSCLEIGCGSGAISLALLKLHSQVFNRALFHTHPSCFINCTLLIITVDMHRHWCQSSGRFPGSGQRKARPQSRAGSRKVSKRHIGGKRNPGIRNEGVWHGSLQSAIHSLGRSRPTSSRNSTV